MVCNLPAVCPEAQGTKPIKNQIANNAKGNDAFSILHLLSLLG